MKRDEMKGSIMQQTSSVVPMASISYIKHFALNCLTSHEGHLMSFFEFSLVKHIHGHSFKSFKRRSNTCEWSSFFSEHVVNARNSLPCDTNFNPVAGSKRSMAKVDFIEFLKVDFVSS